LHTYIYIYVHISAYGDQCIEPFVCNAVNPIVDSVAREGILRSSRSLRNAVSRGEVDLEAREDLSIASLLGGLSLANAKLGTVHGFASVLGGI
jgi:alcohol dehydrogenase class IV